jgi:hypothetical protein
MVLELTLNWDEVTLIPFRKADVTDVVLMSEAITLAG